MDNFKKSIDRQITFNQGKNILHNKPGPFRFISETTGGVGKMTDMDNASLQVLIDYTTYKALEEFCRVNQYYSFNTEAKEELRGIYADLFEAVKADVREEVDSHEHYVRLRNWLIKYNAFAGNLYGESGENIEPVACSEYSAHIQVDILQVDSENILQPVLDIGCGKQGMLVSHFMSKGIEACGIDRFSFTRPNLFTADWLEYDYGVSKWGTVISHLGFTNHFSHHNLREDGNYLAYGKTYMKILQSLKIGGSFHYAPGLPFIEKYLDDQRYALTVHPIEGHDFKTVVIKRLA